MTRTSPTFQLASRSLAALLTVLIGCVADRPPSATGQIVDDVPVGDLPGFLFDARSSDGGLAPRGVNPYPSYDVSYVMALNDPEETFTIDVEPRAGRLDVHFSIDTTGSFGGEIQMLKESLQETLIPRLRERVTDLAIGVSRFGDFPVRPFGLPSDRPYDLLTPVTTDFGRVTYAVFSLDRPLQNGGDVPEGWLEALYQIATGAGLVGPQGGSIEPFVPRPDVLGSGVLGGVGFRAGAARVVVNVTDAPAHDPYDYGSLVPGTHSLDQTVVAMRAVGARVIGIASGDPARPQLEALAAATGAVVAPDGGRCLTGLRGLARMPVGGMCPLVFDIGPDGSGLASSVLDAITRFLDSLAFGTVSGATENDPQGFVTRIEALSAVPPAGATGPQREDRQPAGMPDGVPDTFTGVATRTRLTFQVHVRNTRVATLEQPQLFFVRVTLVGDGVVLGSRVIRIVVPEGPKPDSAVDVSRDRASVDLGVDLGAPDVVLADVAPADVTPVDVTPADVGGDLATDGGRDAAIDSAPDAVPLADATDADDVDDVDDVDDAVATP